MTERSPQSDTDPVESSLFRYTTLPLDIEPGSPEDAAAQWATQARNAGWRPVTTPLVHLRVSAGGSRCREVVGHVIRSAGPPDPPTGDDFRALVERVRDLEIRLDRADDYEREMRERDG